MRIRIDPDAIALAVEDRRTAPPAHLWAHLTEGAPDDVARDPAVIDAYLGGIH